MSSEGETGTASMTEMVRLLLEDRQRREEELAAERRCREEDQRKREEELAAERKRCMGGGTGLRTAAKNGGRRAPRERVGAED